jgi:beta-phosphoglucomutase-like phosphatase (HAD superfamily)
MSVSLTLPSLASAGPFSGVVVDLDGLLVHTERQWLEAKTVLFARYGATLTEADRSAVFGAADVPTAAYFAARLGVPEPDVAALRDEYLGIVSELFDRGVEVTDGAAELVVRLCGSVPLALASNTRRTLVQRILATTPLADGFDVIVCGDEAPPKPAPDLYLLACRRLGLEPARCLALEDSPTGVRAARHAGLTCVGVPSDPRHPLPEADAVIGSLSELLEAMSVSPR